MAVMTTAPTPIGAGALFFAPYSKSRKERICMLENVLQDSLRTAVIDVARIVRENGGRALLVGGAVRDMLLGADSAKDVDIEVFGIGVDRLQDILKTRFKIDLVGLSFGVLKLHHYDIDVSLPRRESKRGLGHKGFEIFSDPSIPVEEAALRRDFTINAIYCDPLTDEIIDPVGGVADLTNRVLRHVSDKFVEDPLRVLRGMQFVARFNLDAAPETIELCRQMTMEGLPPERLYAEWEKLLLKGIKISKGLDFLRETGWVRYFPELNALIDCEQEPEWHPEGDVWNHTCMCLDVFAENRTGDDIEDLTVGFAVLCHDLGKPATTKHMDGRIRSLGHDTVGVKPTLAFLRRLTNEERILKEVPPLVKSHMSPYALWKSNAGDAAIRRLAVKVIRIDRLCRVTYADNFGRAIEEKSDVEIKWLLDQAERLRIKDSAPKPLMMGRDLIEMGLTPSPKFGEILSKCFEAQLEGVFSDREGGRKWLEDYVQSKISYR